MLALIASRLAAPVDEAIDRDPGIITLAASVFRTVTQRQYAAFQRRCEAAGKAPHHISL